MHLFNNKFLTKKTHLVWIITVTVIISSLAVYLYYKNISSEIRFRKYNELSAIAELKADQLTQWLNERVSEAYFFSENSEYKSNIESLLTGYNGNAVESLFKGLSHIKRTHGYENIFILSAEHKLLFSLDTEFQHVDTSTVGFADNAIEHNTVLFTDFYICGITKKSHLDIIAPVKNRFDKVIAAMIFRIDPNIYLYPLIQSWPLPSRSSETLLVKRDRDSVVFLNEVKHIKNEPLKFKIPMTAIDVPAVQAVTGHTGIIDGNDYRNNPVLADMRPVEGTSWFMIAKVDKEEILAELYSNNLYLIIFLFLIILFISAGSAAVYSYRQRNIFKYLYETQEEFKTTLYSIGDAVITTDKRGYIKYVNAVAENLTGWQESEARGKKLKDVFSIVNEVTKETVENPVTRVLKEGMIVGLANHTLLISKDGKEIPIADSGAPIKDEEGNVIGVVLVFRDQTKERTARAELEQSEARYHSLFNSIRDAILVADSDRKIINCNPAFTEIFGYTLEEIYGKKTLYVYENEEQFIELGNAIKEHHGKKSFTYTVNYKRKDGAVFPGETGVFYLENNAGQITGFIGLIRDITERKLAEENLKEKINELEIFNKAMVGRESKMLKLKNEINQLCVKLGLPPKYSINEKLE